MIGVDEAYINGTLKWLIPQGPKWMLEIKSLYNYRGDWAPGPFNYVSTDACRDFVRKDAPWYQLTRYFEGHCPPKKNVKLFYYINL